MKNYKTGEEINAESIQALRQQVEALTRRVDVQELELQFYKTQEYRVIPATQYAERAVAKAFGLLPNLPDNQRHLAFYRHQNKRKAGRPFKQVDPQQANYLNARFLLCSILYTFFGYSVNQLASLYGINNDERLRMVTLFELVHLTPEEVAAEDKKLYDQYAAKYRLVYQYMKNQMQQDGYWDSAYEAPALA